MDAFISFLAGTSLFLALASIVYHYTRNLVIPFVAWMLIIGIVYSLLRAKTEIFTDWPALVLSPDIVLFLLVPLLIFESGRKFRIQEFEQEKIPIALFSVVGVLATTFIIGYPMSKLLEIPLVDGLLLGAILAPTDPVAVTAVFQNFSVPKRLKIQMEGESLFNDATGILMFTLMYGIVIDHQEVSPDNAIFYFLQSIGGGMVVGSILGWVTGTLLNTWKENELSGAILTLSLAISSSLITENLFHASGIIGALFAAMIFMRTETQMTKEEWKVFNISWDHVGIVSNSILFFLLGSTLGLHSFVIEQMIFQSPWIIFVSIATLVISRAIVVYGLSGFLNIFHVKIPRTWQHILYLGGIRGAISVALLLTLPVDYPHRESFLCFTFLLIFYTLVAHPLFINRYLKKNDVGNDDG